MPVPSSDLHSGNRIQLAKRTFAIVEERQTPRTGPDRPTRPHSRRGLYTVVPTVPKLLHPEGNLSETVDPCEILSEYHTRRSVADNPGTCRRGGGSATGVIQCVGTTVYNPLHEPGLCRRRGLAGCPGETHPDGSLQRGDDDDEQGRGGAQASLDDGLISLATHPGRERQPAHARGQDGPRDRRGHLRIGGGRGRVARRRLDALAGQAVDRQGARPRRRRLARTRAPYGPEE